MNISYQRSPLKGYMIIRGREKDIGYQEQMLQENAIPFLLPFYAMAVNLELEVWYDITGQRSLRDVITQEGVTMENLKRVMEGLSRVFYQLQQYLIRQEDVYMDPDTVYFDRDDPDRISLCFCPVEHPGTQEQLFSLMGFLVEQVDHNQKNITRLCYELFEIAQDPVSMEQLVKKVRDAYGMEVEAPKETIPSENRCITIRSDREEIKASRPEEKENVPEKETEIESKKKKESKWKKKWQGFLAKAKEEMLVQFPVLSRLEKKRRKNDEEEVLWGEDFVFDPEAQIQQKTQLLREEDTSAAGEVRRDQAQLVYDGNGQEEDYILDKKNFSIGSMARDNDAILHSDVVSRHHATSVRETDRGP